MATAPTENAPKLSKSILQRETHKDLTNLISKPLSFHCKSMGEGREGVFNRYLICTNDILLLIGWLYTALQKKLLASNKTICNFTNT